MARQRIPITKSMAQNYSWEETTPRHQHKHLQKSCRGSYYHKKSLKKYNTRNIPCQYNQPKKNIPVLTPHQCPNSPDALGFFKEAKVNMARLRQGPRFTEHHGAENMANTSHAKRGGFSFAGKKLEQTWSCFMFKNSGCKWKSPCGPYCLAVRKRAS